MCNDSGLCETIRAKTDKITADIVCNVYSITQNLTNHKNKKRIYAFDLKPIGLARLFIDL